MTMGSELDWDLLRYFLAVMRSGSLRQAAQQLGASHPTVRRRLLALEEQIGFRLFDRGSETFQPTAEALALQQHAEAVETSVHAFTRCADNADPRLEGSIQISAPDLVMSDLLAEDLAAFKKRWPQIILNVETTYELANLGNRDADIAIRLGPRESLPNQNLLGMKAATVYAAIYGHGDHWLGWEDQAQQVEMIKSSPFADVPIQGIINNVYVQRAACQAGMGICMLPCFFADGFLERRIKPEPVADIWVLVHPDLQQNPRLRLFRDAIVKAFKRHRAKLEGTQVKVNQPSE
jgi:DNA-binding transcriptional LysR family regulator